MISAGVGRSCGCLARQRSSSACSSAGTLPSSGSSCTTRYSPADSGPSPNGGVPPATYAASEPSANTSVAGVAGPPWACSGAMNAGEPIRTPVPVSAVASPARAMPKSMTRGPSVATSTLAGLRSRCTTPASWIACSASAIPPISSSTVRTGSAPCARTTCCSEGPGTYAVTSQGVSASVPASITCAVYSPWISRALATSRANRPRNSASSANSGRTTFTATGRPPGVYER